MLRLGRKEYLLRPDTAIRHCLEPNFSTSSHASLSRLRLSAGILTKTTVGHAAAHTGPRKRRQAATAERETAPYVVYCLYRPGRWRGRSAAAAKAAFSELAVIQRITTQAGKIAVAS